MFATKIIIALDSFLIDILVLICVGMFLINGTISVTYIAPIFYLTRDLSLAIGGQWPKPTPYLFIDTNFLSLFVSYAPTNDLYFSGHIGITTFIFIVTATYRYKKLTGVSCFALVYTGLMLTVTDAHYTNDMIIGHIMSVVSVMVGFRYMYECTFELLQIYCAICDKIEPVVRLNKRNRVIDDNKA